MAHVEDRWYDRDGQPTDRHGRGKRYRVRWRDPSGRPRAHSEHRRVDADRFAATVTTDMLRGAYVAPDAGRVTLADYVEEWLAGYHPPSATTREGVEQRLRRHVLPALGRHQLAALRPSLLRQWLRALSGELAPSTARQIYKSLAQVLAAAVDDGHLAVSPLASRSITPPSVPRRLVAVWTQDVVDDVAGELPDRLRVLVTVGAMLGLRQGEAFGLALEDVDWLRRVVRVRRQITMLAGRPVYGPPKGGVERDVPLADAAARELAEHVRRHDGPAVTLPWLGGRDQAHALLARADRGGPLRRQDFNRRVWKPALERAGIEPTRANGFHVLRHTYASTLLSRGVGVHEVARYLGHADASVTLSTYAHLLPDSADRARAVFDARRALDDAAEANQP